MCHTQVKFGNSNGETKVDIQMPSATLTGMGKEELMKFANDPFWVRFRWILFVSFWVLWLAMLAGAIAIIVMAPKCVPPEPKKFWEESVMVDLDFENAEPKNFEGLNKKLDELKSHNVRSISLPQIFAENEPGKIINFKEINKNYGSMENFNKFMKNAKERGQYVVLELNPHATGLEHEWFQKSIKMESPYADYYIWHNSSDTKKNVQKDENEEDFKMIWNDKRQQNYYVFPKNSSQPLLNYNNPAVVTEMKDILSHWLKLGISGFRFLSSPFLIKNLNRKNEEYHSIIEQNVQLIKDLRQVVMEHTGGQGLLAFKEPMGHDIVQLYKEKNMVVDLIYTSKIVTDLAKNGVEPQSFGQNINALLTKDSSWPSWDLKRFAGKMNSEEAGNVMLFTMLLPGTPVVRLEDINNNTREMFDELSKARSDATFQYGDYSIYNLHNNTVVAYTRTKIGSPGYLVAYYIGNEKSEVDFSSLSVLPNELETMAYSANYVQNGTRVQTKFYTKSVLLQPKSTLAMKFIFQK